MRIEYPIALDSDYGVWSTFGNRYWPAVYLADAEGRIRYHHFGEGEYDDGEWMIQHLLREARRRGHRRRARLRHRGGFGGASRLDEPGLSRDLPRLPAGAEPRLSRRCRVRRATRLRRARVVAAQQLGPGRKLDDRGAGERAERSRRANRLPLACARRPSRPALASGHGRPVPRAGRRRSARRSQRAGRRRGGPGNAGTATALSAGALDQGLSSDRAFEIAFDAPGVEACVFTFG